jgi:transcription antitermination factor NusA-like protein
MIAGQQAACVSYFCKIEQGREFKVVEYSPNFKEVVERIFAPEDVLYIKKAA